MPLRVEIFIEESRRWIQTGPELLPENNPGTISDNKADHTRDLYMFQCEPDDSSSTIYRSGQGMDTNVEWGVRLASIDPSQLEVVKELQPGEPYEMTITPDKQPRPITIRFSHVSQSIEK